MVVFGLVRWSFGNGWNGGNGERSFVNRAGYVVDTGLDPLYVRPEPLTQFGAGGYGGKSAEFTRGAGA